MKILGFFLHNFLSMMMRHCPQTKLKYSPYLKTWNQNKTMKTKITLMPRACFAVFLTIAMIVSLFGNSSASTATYTTPSSFAPWEGVIQADRTVLPLTAVIYDDELLNPNPQPSWNCGRKFLFLTYKNDQIDFICDNDHIAAATAAVTSIYIEIKDGSGAVAYSGYQARGSSWSFTPSSTGSFTIMSYYKGTSNTPLSGGFQVLDRIQKIWLEASPICTSTYTTGQDYQLKLKTIPTLNTLPYTIRQYLGNRLNNPPTNAFTDCSIDVDIAFTITNSTDFPVSGPFVPIYSVLEPTVAGGIDIVGYDATVYSPFPPNLEDYFIKYSDIAPYLAGATTQLHATFAINDGITTYPSRTIPIVISQPAPGSNDATNYHFDILQAQGNDVWTPQNNPLTDLTGNDEYVIKVKNGISVPVNKTLSIQGMTVEIGPSGTVDVMTNPTTISGHATNAPYGGILKLDDTKFTALRNCDNTSNYWQGARVWGDATETQTIVNTTTGQSKQGTLEMTGGSEISYASWGVINVGPTANSGSATGK